MAWFDELTKLSLMNFFLHLFFLSPVAVFFYQQRGLDYFQILVLESVLVVFMFLFEIPTGIFADKFGRKKSILLGALLLSLEPALFLFAENFFVFAVAFALAGIGLTFHSGTIEALLYDYLKAAHREHEMKKAMGRFGSAALLAMVIAPVIGSYFARDLLMSQFILLLLLTLGAMCLGFLLSFSLRDTAPFKGARDSRFLLRSGLRLVRHNKSLRRIVLLSLFTDPFLFTLMYLSQPFFQSVGVRTAAFGLIFSLALLLAAALKRYAYLFEEWFGVKRAVFLVTILPGLLYILLAFVTHPLVAIAVFLLLRALIALRGPLFADYRNRHISSMNRATVLSLISMFVSSYLIGLRVIIGVLADRDVRYAFLFMGVIILSASILLRLDERQLVFGPPSSPDLSAADKTI